MQYIEKIMENKDLQIQFLQEMCIRDSSRRTEVAEKDCGKIRLAEESKTAERTKIKNA